MQTPLANKYPNLYSYAKARHMSLQSCLAPTNCLNIFRLPMSRVAYNEFLSFQEELEFFRSKSDMDDIWIYKWKSPTYRSSKFYQKHFESIVPPMPYKWIWQSKCMPRIKFFTWLLLNDRLNTRDMLRRRHQVLEEGYQCVMHQQNIDETLHLLFFYCSSSQSRWFAVGIQWDMQGDLEQLLIHQKQNFSGPMFMDLFMITSWCIWKERNDYIFQHKPPSMATWKRRFRDEVKLHLYRVPPNLQDVIMNWTNSL